MNKFFRSRTLQSTIDLHNAEVLKKIARRSAYAFPDNTPQRERQLRDIERLRIALIERPVAKHKKLSGVVFWDSSTLGTYRFIAKPFITRLSGVFMQRYDLKRI